MKRSVSNEPAAQKSADRNLTCDRWLSLLPERLDGSLSVGALAAFAHHQQRCALCASCFAEATEGLAWLDLVRTEPQVPSALVQSILDRTSGRECPLEAAYHTIGVSHSAPLAIAAIGERLHSLVLRTAAMAFFSLALTMNLMDVRVTHLRFSDLSSASLRMTLSHRFHSMSADAMRIWASMRQIPGIDGDWRKLLSVPADSQAPATPASRNSFPTSSHDAGGEVGSCPICRTQTFVSTAVFDCWVQPRNRKERAFTKSIGNPIQQEGHLA